MISQGSGGDEIVLPAVIANRWSQTVKEKQKSELINQGRSEILPPVMANRGRFGTFSQVYAHPDKALQESRVNSEVMENSLLIRECIEARMRAVVLQDIDVVPLEIHKMSSEERDQFGDTNKINPNKVNAEIGVEELAKKTKLMKLMEYMPQHRLYALMNAIWYGRYGVENQFGSRYVQGVGTFKNVITGWRPKHGDKYIFRFDDGRHTVEEGQVGIRISSYSQKGRQTSFTDVNGKQQLKTISTPYGFAYLLDPIERQATTIHKHIVEDGTFEDPRSTGSIYGVGIRSRVYWTWWQMQETIKIMMNYLERTGLGIELWYYPANNKKQKANVEQMMKERGSSGYAGFLVPVQPGEDAETYKPEILSPTPGGVAEMNEIITTRFHDEIKRYIMGQKLTSEADATGLGGNLADIHLATFADIVKFDTLNLEATETETMRYQQHKTFKGSNGIWLSFKLKSRDAERAEALEAIEKAHGLGFNVSREQLGDVLGMAEAKQGSGDGLLDTHNPMGGAGMMGPFNPGFDQSPENQAMFPPNMINQNQGDEMESTRYSAPQVELPELDR